MPLLLAALAAAALMLLATPLAAEEEESEAHIARPEDFRPQTLPPPRPITRTGGTWIERGPSPTQTAQVNVPPDFEVSGAIQAIAAHPTATNIVYVGAVNGGVWKTTNATDLRPTWRPLTDHLPSLSISALVFDPTDASRLTLVAGTGRRSSLFQYGDDHVGIYRTTDGGNNWARLGATGSPSLLGKEVSDVVARGPLLLVATQLDGLYRSIDTGATWTPVSGTGVLPAGGIFDMAEDPANLARLYISVRGAAPKILRSDTTGNSWIDITPGVSGLIASTANSRMRLAVGANSSLYLAVVDAGVLSGVFHSANQGGAWSAMDVPAIHPGSQGYLHTSIAADPDFPNLVYLGGDRTVATTFGNLVRGNSSAVLGSQFTTIVNGNAGNTAPHADSRALAFDAAGSLLDANDGGIYRRSLPTSSTGVWRSAIGNLSVMEVHDLAHDAVANILVIGTQDNGTQMQQTAGNPRWTQMLDGDGGDVAIDSSSLGAAGSFRYLSLQNLGGFRRDRYNASNLLASSLAMPVVPSTQFVTPIELNVTDPSRMLIAGGSFLYQMTGANGPSPALFSYNLPNVSSIAFGTAKNANAAYLGYGTFVLKYSGNIFVGTAGLPAGANAVTDVAMDPENESVAFAIDNDQVFRSTDAGNAWVDITGNLPAISAQDFRTIEFISDPAGDSVALGTRSGVYTAPVTASVWAPFGNGLPDVLVYDLRYVASTRTLYAGTLGRGVWSTSNGAAAAAGQIDIVGPPGSVDFGRTVTVLPNGNIVVTAKGVGDRGAVYLYRPDGVLISTLVGSTDGDQIGSATPIQSGPLRAIVVLPNGNFVVLSPQWNNLAGAVTWGSAIDGVSGVVSAANSLVGTVAQSGVGSHGITTLSNGNYVVSSPNWGNGAFVQVGAATWRSGIGGSNGAVSASNSLVGSSQFDQVSIDASVVQGRNHGIKALTNGNYVVGSYVWNNGPIDDAGAVTWGNGSTGTVGVVSASNSLVGASANDVVGDFGITALSNGHYAVASSYVRNGNVLRVGAATWGNGNGGTIGPVTAANSLLGSANPDRVAVGGIFALSNGHYVVSSLSWNNGAITNTGAVTWVNGSAPFSGVVSSSNSLIGSSSNDQVGNLVTALTNGHYVVRSPNWANAGIRVGAATWRNGGFSTFGVISAANSLIGTTGSDAFGGDIVALSNGNYVVRSPEWSLADFGAATWGDGSVGTFGTISALNSLVGGGNFAMYSGNVVALSNGNYVVTAPSWSSGLGAATWGNGLGGTVGAITSGNSLVGSAAYDYVGLGRTTALVNGHYVVSSWQWGNAGQAAVGAATWGNGVSGSSGPVAVGNSLVGTTAVDVVGNASGTGSPYYVVRSANWDNGDIVNAGAVTVVYGDQPYSGVVNTRNSIPGTVANAGYLLSYDFDPSQARLVVGQPAANLVSLLDDRISRSSFE